VEYCKTAISFGRKNGYVSSGDSLLNGFRGVKAGYAAVMASGLRFRPLPGDTPGSAAGAYEGYFKPQGMAYKEFVMSEQPHSDIIYEALRPGYNDFTALGRLAAPDAIITRKKNIPLGVFTADCCPLLIYVPDAAAAAVHSGRQGAFLNITGKTVKKLKEICGAGAGDVFVSVGPAICGRCYEVGDKLLETFMRRHPDIEGAYDASLHTVDIRKVILRQLEEEGVPKENISVTKLCTKETLYLPSFRRDKAGSDRIISYIMMS